MLKSTREEQAALVAEDPEVFSTSWAGGRWDSRTERLLVGLAASRF